MSEPSTSVPHEELVLQISNTISFTTEFVLQQEAQGRSLTEELEMQTFHPKEASSFLFIDEEPLHNSGQNISQEINVSLNEDSHSTDRDLENSETCPSGNSATMADDEQSNEANQEATFESEKKRVPIRIVDYIERSHETSFRSRFISGPPRHPRVIFTDVSSESSPSSVSLSVSPGSISSLTEADLYSQNGFLSEPELRTTNALRGGRFRENGSENNMSYSSEPLGQSSQFGSLISPAEITVATFWDAIIPFSVQRNLMAATMLNNALSEYQNPDRVGNAGTTSECPQLSSSVSSLPSPEVAQILMEPARAEERGTRCYPLLTKRLVQVIGVMCFVAAIGFTLGIFLSIFDDGSTSVSDEVASKAIKNSSRGTEGNFTFELQDFSNEDEYYTFGYFEYPGVTAMFLAVSLGALICGACVRCIGHLNVMMISCLLSIIATTVEITSSSALFMSFVVAGLSLGLGSTASIVWITEHEGNQTRGITTSSVPCFIAIGMLSSLCKEGAYGFVWLTGLYMAFLCFKEKKPVTTPLISEDSDTTLDENSDPQTQMRVCGCACCQFLRQRASMNENVSFWERWSKTTVFKPLAILCIINILQQVSGSAFALFVAPDFYEEYGCYVTYPEIYNVAMVLVSIGVTTTVFVYICFRERRQLVTIVCQLMTTCALICASGLCVYYHFHGTGEDGVCGPGALMSVAGLTGVGGSLLVPLVCCPELLPACAAPLGTGVIVAADAAVLAVLLSVGRPLLLSAGHAVVACACAAASCVASLAACLYLPDI